jgi:hypothetical protein
MWILVVQAVAGRPLWSGPVFWPFWRFSSPKVVQSTEHTKVTRWPGHLNPWTSAHPHLRRGEILVSQRRVGVGTGGAGGWGEGQMVWHHEALQIEGFILSRSPARTNEQTLQDSGPSWPGKQCQEIACNICLFYLLALFKTGQCCTETRIQNLQGPLGSSLCLPYIQHVTISLLGGKREASGPPTRLLVAMRSWALLQQWKWIFS